MGAFGEAYPRFASLGAWLGGISPQDLDHSRQTMKELNLPYAILSDQGNGVARMFGLAYPMPEGVREIYRTLGIDLPEHNGDDSWVLPVPAAYIVDASGMITHRWIDPDFTRLPDPEEVLGQIELTLAEAAT